MADIIKCRGENCLVKEKCYRYLAEPHEVSWAQEWFPKTLIDKDGKCEYFWDVYEFEDLRRYRDE